MKIKVNIINENVRYMLLIEVNNRKKYSILFN